MDGELPQKRLEVHAVALEMAVMVARAVQRMPRGNGPLADQMSRASLSTVLLIAEGANRVTAGEKRVRFSTARGEAGEVAAAAELARVLGILRVDEASAIESHATRIAAMLTRLIQRFS